MSTRRVTSTCAKPVSDTKIRIYKLFGTTLIATIRLSNSRAQRGDFALILYTRNLPVPFALLPR